MPTNPEQIHRALQEIGRNIGAQSAADQNSQARALQLLHTHATDFSTLETVEAIVARFDPNLRCAVPVSERIDMGYPAGAADSSQTIIAVDGSQVSPDRHEDVLFGLINIGRVVLRTKSGQTPEIQTETTILFGKALYPNDGPLMSEGEIALLRDKSERSNLLHFQRDGEERALALTDGPLELWGAKDVSDPRAFQDALTEYLEDLRAMERRGWTVAGYVDKPGADLVIRLFEILEAEPEQLKSLRNYHPLRGVSDRWLFGRILSPTHRSAVFALQSKSKRDYAGNLSIHFFYLNVGSEGHPAIARVEIPAWVARSAPMINALHSALIDQCRLLGARPYPYILQRAHETARISVSEKEELKLRLLLELRDHEVVPEGPSGKSSAKRRSEIRGSY
jgi:hypothetical protein